jgi:TIR domain-containing protein
MAGIFVSYREADAKAWAISLRDDLVEVFGTDQVFLDKDTLHAGNWREQIQSALDRCKVVLVVIGPRWLTIADDQNRPRIHLADDVHHQEIALALSRSDVTVIPVLVDEASMPGAKQLPEDLRKLSDQQARKVGDTEARRKADLEVLVKDIEAVGGISARARPGGQDRPSTPSTPERTSWLKLDMVTLGSAFALTLIAGMYAYLSNHQLGTDELFFVLLVFCALVLGARWLWHKFVGGKKGET